MAKLPHRRLASFDTVIRTLGGTKVVAEMVGKKSSHVSNWKRVSQKIPAKYYLIIQGELEGMGFVAADHLFNFAKPVKKRKRRQVYCDTVDNVIVYERPHDENT